MFHQWVCENATALNKMNFKFLSNYHGGDEAPVIFGFYGGFSLADSGCAQIDTSKFSDIIETEKKVRSIFSTIPKVLAERFPPLAQAGFWSNEHSS